MPATSASSRCGPNGRPTKRSTACLRRSGCAICCVRLTRVDGPGQLRAESFTCRERIFRVCPKHLRRLDFSVSNSARVELFQAAASRKVFVFCPVFAALWSPPKSAGSGQRQPRLTLVPQYHTIHLQYPLSIDSAAVPANPARISVPFHTQREIQ